MKRVIESTSDGSIRLPAAHARGFRPGSRRAARASRPRRSACAARFSSPTPASSTPATPAAASRLLEAAGHRRRVFHEFGANPDSDMVEAGRRLRRAVRRRTRSSASAAAARSTAPRDQLPADQRRRRWPTTAATARRATPLLPMIGVPTTAGNGQRGAELRGDRRRGDAHEDGLRRPVRGGHGSRSSIRS